MIMIAIACAGADMVVSIVTNTGLALGIASVIGSWSGGFMMPALLLIMITSLILGMGLPCTPAYIIAVTIGGPALQSIGVDLLSAHLFVFYFAILASVTPPVCIAAYCGAAIAGSRPLHTGYEAFKLALIGFVIPYVFVHNQALLMRGAFGDIMTVVVILLIAVILLSGGMSGYLHRNLGALERAGIVTIAFGLFTLCAHGEIIALSVVKFLTFLVPCLCIPAMIFLRKRRNRKASPLGAVE